MPNVVRHGRSLTAHAAIKVAAFVPDKLITGRCHTMTLRMRVHRRPPPVEGDAVEPEQSETARGQVLAELHLLRGRMSGIEGSVVATTDGLVVAHDLGAAETYGIEASGVAALAAVNLGLSQRIADTASHGELLETVIRGTFGQVVTYAAGDRALLTVLVRSSAELAPLHEHARASAKRVAGLLADAWADDAATWHSTTP